jgi:hypothetical protein
MFLNQKNDGKIEIFFMVFKRKMAADRGKYGEIRLIVNMHNFNNSSLHQHEHYEICNFTCENYLDSQDRTCSITINTNCPIRLLEIIFKMMRLRRIVEFRESSDGQTQITVNASSYIIDRYVSLINQILRRSIYQISEKDANQIIRKLSIPPCIIYCIEEYNGFCLVVLTPIIVPGLFDPDFREGQSWTLFNNAVLSMNQPSH